MVQVWEWIRSLLILETLGYQPAVTPITSSRSHLCCSVNLKLRKKAARSDHTWNLTRTKRFTDVAVEAKRWHSRGLLRRLLTAAFSPAKARDKKEAPCVNSLLAHAWQGRAPRF